MPRVKCCKWEIMLIGQNFKIGHYRKFVSLSEFCLSCNLWLRNFHKLRQKISEFWDSIKRAKEISLILLSLSSSSSQFSAWYFSFLLFSVQFLCLNPSEFFKMAFLGTTQKCKACEKTVYLVDQLTADNKVYHKACFRCHHCKSTLKVTLLNLPSSFSSIEVYTHTYICIILEGFLWWNVLNLLSRASNDHWENPSTLFRI